MSSADNSAPDTASGAHDADPMTPAELRVVREFLGLSGTQLAALLEVSDRTVRHWETGRYPVPDFARRKVEQIEADAGATVAAAVDAAMDAPEPVILTYPTDEAFHAAHPHITYPASWHRAVVARVAQEVTGLGIDYADDKSAP